MRWLIGGWIVTTAMLGGGILVLSTHVNGLAGQVSHPAVTAQQREITALRAQLAAPRQARLPAIVGHYGVCFSATGDDQTGDVLNVDITTPDDNGGVVSCPNGEFVSVAPGG